MRIYIRDQNDAVLDVLDDTYYDLSIEDFLKGKATVLSFSMVKDEMSYKLITTGKNLSFVYDGEEYWLTCMIVEQDEYYLSVTAWSIGLEYNNETIGPYKSPKAMTFAEYLNVIDFEKVLTVGINEVSDKKISYEWTGTDKKLARLYSLANVFDAEIAIVTRLNDDGSLKQIVINIYHEHDDSHQGVGNDRRNETFYFEEEIKTIKKTEDKTGLYTAITATGKDGLTIASIDREVKDENGLVLYKTVSKATDDFPDVKKIYAVQARLQFPSTVKSNDRWTVNDTGETEYSSAEALYGYMLSQLKENSIPKVTWEIEGNIKAKIGDTVRIADEGYKPTLYLEARVTGKVRKPDNLEQETTTFSNVKELQSQVDQSLIDRVNALIEETRPYTVNLITDNGVNFKNSEGSTTLSAIVYSGTKDITADVTVRWYKNDVWVKTGYDLTINASDIIDKAVYRAEVMDTNGVIRAKAEVTVFNVDDGRGIKGKPVLSYASSGSINTVPTTWQSTIPAVPAGSYLWTREVTTYSDDTTSEVITPVLQGPKGDPGNDGIAGKDGIGIKSTQIMYAQSTSGTTAPTTGWTAQVPTLIKGQYLWTQTTWVYTDNTGEAGYTVSYNAKDGNNGTDGVAGKDGVGITSTTITYAQSASGTIAPTTGYTASVPSVDEGYFLWTKTVWAYTDNTTETGYSVAKQGKKGADGKDGKGVIDSKQEWAASTSGTTAPTVWQATIPTVSAGQYLWSRITETWSDNTKTYKFTIGKIGENGQNAQMMFLSATANQMMFNADNTPKTAQSSVVTAKYQNVSGTVAFTAKGIKTDGTSETLTLTGSGDSRTITSAMFKTDWVMITVTATLAGLTDTLSIIKVNDGAQGIGGKNGYFHSAWAMSADGRIGFSTTDSTGKWYIGTYFDFVEADSTDPTRYNWLELAGAVNMHFAYAWSPDGTDRFTRVKPGSHVLKSSLSHYQPYGSTIDNHSLYFTQTSIYLKKGKIYTIHAKATNGVPSNLHQPTVESDKVVLWLISSNQSINQIVSDKDLLTTGSTFAWDNADGEYHLRVNSYKTDNSIWVDGVEVIEGSTYYPDPKDDYDNAIPRYIGRSLKDSNNQADFKFEPNPERKPWTSYASGLNGEGLSLMPYGENQITSALNTLNWKVNGWGGYTSFSSDGKKLIITALSGWCATRFKVPDELIGKKLTLSFNAILDGSKTTATEYTLYLANGLSGKFDTTTIANTSDIQKDKLVRYSATFVMNETGFVGVTTNNAPEISGQTTVWTIDDIKLELANTMGIPTPWTPAPSEDPLGAIPKYVGTASLPYDDPYKYSYSLNPEWVDMNNNLISQGKLDNNQYQNDQGTVWETISNLVTKEEYEQIVQTANDLLSLQKDMRNNMTDAQDAIGRLESGVTTINNILKDTVEKWTFINNYMIAGEDGLSIGDLATNLKILISEDKISFMDGGTEVAYFTNQEFKINRGMIVDKLQINTHVIGRLSDDHTVISWVGG